MITAYFCQCRACGTRVVWATSADANQWGQSHWQPELVARLYVGALGGFGLVVP